jgi:hypothetical protein
MIWGIITLSLLFCLWRLIGSLPSPLPPALTYWIWGFITIGLSACSVGIYLHVGSPDFYTF